MLTCSLIVPVYNRPNEVDELLQSIQEQTMIPYEIVIVEDGSEISCEQVVKHYASHLPIVYYTKSNGGPGAARNYGAAHATGDYLIILDSDVLLPPHYIQTLTEVLETESIDAFGGPDAAHPNFSPIQKAISYAMTSFYTTGGIRGSKSKGMDKFHPRSFNMGIRRSVYETLKGFREMRFGEDIDFSYRILEAGYSTQLIPDAWVYHKRRSTFQQFFKQVHNSGIARINLEILHPGTLKLVHTLPALFTTGTLFCIAMRTIWSWTMLPLCIFTLLILVDATKQSRSVHVGLLAILAAYTQLIGYGTGFLRACWKRYILRQDSFEAFSKNFYK